MNTNLGISTVAEFDSFPGKYWCVLECLEKGASPLKAWCELAALTGMTVHQARYVVGKLPQKLCLSGTETFRAVVLTSAETQMVSRKLDGLFDYHFSEVYEHVLPYGCCVTVPWDTHASVGPVA